MRAWIPQECGWLREKWPRTTVNERAKIYILERSRDRIDGAIVLEERGKKEYLALLSFVVMS